jgi:DNA-binding Lrp family transcriptional regulator
MLASTCQSSSLTPLERQYILLTQNGLPLIAKPYHWLADKLDISVEKTLAMTNDFIERGVIRRIAAVPNHYKLGYKYNGMTVWDIEDSQASKFGDAVGKLPFVSHCYLRPRHLPQWNYNLFAMVHGTTPEQIDQYRDQIKDLLQDVLQDRTTEKDVKNKSCDMLISTKILKKTGLRLKNVAQKNSGEKNV